MGLIDNLLKTNEKLHFTLIDPEDQPPDDAASIAMECESYGTDAIMIGGSTVKSREYAYKTVEAIKNSVGIPTIWFPNSADTIPGNVDYIFFMILLNSGDEKYLKSEQLRGAPIVRKFGIKPIKMIYLLVSTGETQTTVEKIVEKNARLDRIGYNDIEKAENYAIAAEDCWGSECIYLEAGSGAERPISNEMINAVRKAINIPIIVGGGIRDAKTAREKLSAGADAIVNGTLVESDRKKIKEIIEEIKKF